MRMVGAVSLDHRQFAIGASESADIDILRLAFRGVAARFRLRGVHGTALRRLYNRFLPEEDCPVNMEEAAEAELDEFDDIVQLLLDHRGDDTEETEWLACAMATACFGDNHLWQDMGLPNRAVLSELLRVHFTLLHDKNEGNMKWKKFFYKQICERMQVQVCKAPSCSVCCDYQQCFGPEEETAS
jgi:nitrogen fixation protein NifQ